MHGIWVRRVRLCDGVWAYIHDGHLDRGRGASLRAKLTPGREDRQSRNLVSRWNRMRAAEGLSWVGGVFP